MSSRTCSAFAHIVIVLAFVAVGVRYGGAKPRIGTDGPSRASGVVEELSPVRTLEGCGLDPALRIDALEFTDAAVVLPVSWTPGLLASGSVLSVWGTAGSLTNAFSELSAFAVPSDWLTNAVLSAPFTNALHSQGFFSVRSDADADGDGLCDYLESVVFGSDPHSPDTNGDGFTDLAKYRIGLDPTNEPPAVVEHTPALSSAQVCPAFALPCTNGIGGAFYSRTINVGRDTPFRQFFLSASPTGAAEVCFGGLRIDYRDSSGFGGSVALPGGDSIRLQLSSNAISSVTVEMHATGASPWMSTPLHLVSWDPGMTLSGISGTCTVAGGETADLLVGKQSAGISVDRSGRPSRGPLSREEEDALEFFPCPDGVSVDLGARRRSADVPRVIFSDSGLYLLVGGHRVLVMLPSVTYGVGHCYAGTALGGSDDSVEETSPYPLDSKCLWDRWVRGEGEAWGCSCRPEVYAGVDTNLYPFVTASMVSSAASAEGRVYVSGEEVWRDTAAHDVRVGRTGSDALDGDECCSGGCSNGSCDEYEGDGLGSVRFRIPLGLTAKDRIAGFLWFERDAPFSVSPGSFELLARPDADVADGTTGGVRRVVCADPRGRTLCVSNVAAGVRIAVTETLGGGPVHSWEITNPTASSMRFRKISRIGNVMSDRTYAFAGGVWSRIDNVSGEETSVSSSGDLCEDLRRREERIVRCAGRVAEHVETERSVVGWGGNAVLRETYRRELGADGVWKESFASYWDDWLNPPRHGQLRLVWGDDRAWRYSDYDGSGRETLRIEQRDGSPAPEEWEDWYVDSLPLQRAFVTVFDYAPLAGDSNDPRDAEKPRCESRYVSEDGVKTLVGRTWRVYARGVHGGLPTSTVTTTRACSADALPADSGNAVSTETRFADDAGAVPLVLRGALVSSSGEDGVETENTYSLADGVLACTSRKSLASQFPTYETTETDAYGNVLRRTTRLTDGDAAVADERMSYDDQNRLRSKACIDGTVETNAYSCCRLLWSADRTGARTLRSATTGTDRLYYAEEDLGARDLPRITEVYDDSWSLPQFRQAYPVVQHFFDALGRETNTVRRSAMVEGEAVSPSFPRRGGYVVEEIRTFPQGVSDVEDCVDGRGLRTVRTVRHGQSCETTSEEEWDPGASAPSVVATNVAFRGGGTAAWRSCGGKWTLRSAFSVYGADGCRTDFVVTETGGGAAVTNSATAHDFLGRVVRRTTPTASVACFYDGASPRVAATFDAVSGVAATNVYNATGEMVGTVSGGVLDESRVSYACASGAWWRVETRTVSAGGVTNACSQTRTRLTGLSDALRSEVVEIRDGAEMSHSTTAWDAAAGALTQTVWSATSGPSWAKLVHGREAESVSAAGRVDTYFSPLGLPFYRKRSRPDGGGTMRRWTAEVVDGCGDVKERALFHGQGASTMRVAEFSHDCRGNVVEAVDEAGNAVTNAVDADGRVVASWGATHPVEFSYDAEGRRVELRTTRDGALWDGTQWGYDAATGLCTNKVYADGSAVAYTHTPDGLPLRTTCASGRWRENVYDERRQVVGVSHSSPGDDYAIACDAFGRATNVVGAAGDEWRYVYGAGGAVRREEATQTAAVVVRSFDAYARQTGCSLSVGGVAKGGVGYSYGEDGLLSRVAATNAAGRVLAVAYSNLVARCYGYSAFTPGGGELRRVADRNIYRRDLLNGCSTAFSGSVLDSHAYTYDDISRPTARTSSGVVSTFAYNERSEVVSAQIGTNHFAHGYDFIGNQTLHAANAATNAYTHNALNQLVGRDVPIAPQSVAYAHDLDGNLTNDCIFAYSYDSENRLASVSSASLTNGAVRVVNAYDYRSRRTSKTVQCYMDGDWHTSEYRTFIYDGWNLIHETVATVSGATTNTTEIQYFWGMDLSETLQGAGGVGGLLAVSCNGSFYFPAYDNNGNVTKYIDENGSVVAAYEYDDFGRIISQSGALADFFRIRFSTKYFDSETGLYYYGYRFYSPQLMRWQNRDPILESGGVNLYAFCENNPITRYDVNGQSWLTCFGDCVEEWRLDWSDLLKYSNLPLAFNTMTPKTAKEQLWIKDGNSRYTTPISRAILRGQELALKLPHGRLRSSLIGSLRNLRHFMRNPLLVGTGTILAPLTVFEGFYDIGVMTYCSMHCCGGDQ